MENLPFEKWYTDLLHRADTLGIEVEESNDLDKYFKGDMDGKNIWLSPHLSTEEKVFDLLHMIGHTIQWNVDEELYKLGSVLYQNPSPELLDRLQRYEWEANCYAAYILVGVVGNTPASKWLYKKYEEDMQLLTHFYLTGEKVTEVSKLGYCTAKVWDLEAKIIPKFTPKARPRRRNGLVINFTQ